MVSEGAEFGIEEASHNNSHIPEMSRGECVKFYLFNLFIETKGKNV
jgi:hypothetical protein